MLTTEAIKALSELMRSALGPRWGWILVILLMAAYKKLIPPLLETLRRQRQWLLQLRYCFAEQARLQHKVDAFLADTLLGLLRYPPTRKILRADLDSMQIARHLVWRIKPNSAAPDRFLEHKSEPSPADVADWLAHREHIRRSLENLAPEERRAVLLARTGSSYEEIAMEMAISVDVLRKYLRRGYLTLNAPHPSPPHRDLH